MKENVRQSTWSVSQPDFDEKGNLISQMGRTRAFKSPADLWNKACSYFQFCEDNPWYKNEAKSTKNGVEVVQIPTATPFTLTGLCVYCGITLDTFSNYSKREGYENFFGVCTRIREIIDAQKFEGAAVGVFNASIIARDLGLADKQDITSNGKEIKNIISFGGKEIEV